MIMPMAKYHCRFHQKIRFIIRLTIGRRLESAADIARTAPRAAMIAAATRGRHCVAGGLPRRHTMRAPLKPAPMKVNDEGDVESCRAASSARAASGAPNQPHAISRPVAIASSLGYLPRCRFLLDSAPVSSSRREDARF